MRASGLLPSRQLGSLCLLDASYMTHWRFCLTALKQYVPLEGGPILEGRPDSSELQDVDGEFGLPP